MASVVLLIALGFIMLMSTGGYSQESANDEWAGMRKQAIWLLLGITGCWIMASVDYRGLQRLAWPVFWLAVLALGLCYVPGIGVEVNGAKRWIAVPGIKALQGQPSEFGRLAVIIAMAAWCAKYRDERKSFLKGFVLPMCVVALPIGLIAGEVDLGTTCLLFMVCASMLFVGGARVVYLVGMIAVGAGLFFAAINFGEGKQMGNRKARMTAFMHLGDEAFAREFPDIAELNNQQNQGILALGSGGPLGRGVGEGRQKQHYLPLCHTDFIFPVIGEELGVGATLGTIMAVVCLALSGLLIAAHAPDRFGKLLGTGLVLLIVYQALINIGVTTGCLPNKGMPLPFVSYGGSNLLSCLLAVGILLNIYRHGRPAVLASDPVLRAPKLTPAL